MPKMGGIWVNHKQKIDTYKSYLKSDHWKTLRDRIIKERKFCNRCSGTNQLQVHHLTYKTYAGGSNKYIELDKDLELVCRKCHKKEHNII